MTLYHRCTKLKGQPEMSLPMCIGRWTEAQEKKKSPCKNCTIFKSRLAELVREVLCANS